MKLTAALFFALLCVGASASGNQCCFPGVCCVNNRNGEDIYECSRTSTSCMFGRKAITRVRCGHGNNGHICAAPAKNGESCMVEDKSNGLLCESLRCVNGLCKDCSAHVQAAGIVSSVMGFLCCIACGVGLYFAFRQKNKTTYVQVPNQHMMTPPAVAYAPPVVHQQQAPVVYGQQPQPGMYGQYGHPQAMSAQQPPMVQVQQKPNAHTQQAQAFHAPAGHQPIMAPQMQVSQQPQVRQPNIQTVTVPPGYGEGQKKKIIKLKFNGIEHKIKIPEGKGPGNTFAVNLDLLPRSK